MSISVKTAKLMVEHLQGIFPDAECRRSYMPMLDPMELDDGKIVLCVNPVDRDAERYTQGGMQKNGLAIDVCINAKLNHRNDEHDALTAEIDALVAFAEKVYTIFLTNVQKSAAGFKATFMEPEHVVLSDYSAIQQANCFSSVVRVNAIVLAKPEV